MANRMDWVDWVDCWTVLRRVHASEGRAVPKSARKDTAATLYSFYAFVVAAVAIEFKSLIVLTWMNGATV